jgi:hypothetical protein
MRYILIAVVLLCAICSAQTLNVPAAQAPAAPANAMTVLKGIVSDSSGAVLVEAAVTATSATGVSQSATTDAEGKFVIRDLAPGVYNITVTVPNFRVFKTEGFNVSAGEENSLEAQLQPLGEETHVEVVGQANQVETSTSELSGTITEKQVVTFGLNGRNFTQLISLTPGVSNQTQQDEAKVGVQGSAKYSVNGGRVEYNTFDVDGSDVLNTGIAASRGQSTLIVYPSLDAIEELKVLTSNYGAQYGRSASGTVLVTTKSGGQQFHGNGYEFVRNEIFNSRGFKDPAGSAPLYRRNDFGFTLGGPLYIPKVYNLNKDKTYFFFSEEFRLERTPVAGGDSSAWSQAVPSVNERAGNFSDVCPAVPSGASATVDRTQYPDCPVIHANTSTGYATYPGNMIPIDPNARAILQTGLVSNANSPTGCSATLNTGAITGDPATWPCFVGTTSPNTYWREELFRLDHSFNSEVKASFRYIHDSWDTTVTTPQWQYPLAGGLQSNSFPTVLNRFVGPGISLVAHLTAVKGASFVNDYSMSATKSTITLASSGGPGADLNRPSQLNSSTGIGCLFRNPVTGTCLSDGKIPAIYLGGSNKSLGGTGFLADTSYMPWTFADPTFTMSDNLSKVLGKHTLQTGIQVVQAQQTEWSSATGANTGDVQGLLAFGNVSNPSSTGNTFADFLLLGSQRGTARYYQQDSAQHSYTNRYWTIEPFLQDDWRVSSRLTLNLGLRVSLFGNWTPNNGTAYNFVPSVYEAANAPQVDPTYGYLENANGPILVNAGNPDPSSINGLEQCGVNGVPASCMSSHLFNPAPRIGFAWSPNGDGKTSIRGGYGLFFEHGTAQEANSGSLVGSAPLVQSMTEPGAWQGNTGTSVSGFSWECIGGGTGCGGEPAGAAYPLNVVSIPTRTIWPYVQQWSLSVQRELDKDTVATIAYVGSKGTHLTTVEQLNQLPPVAAQNNYLGANEPVYGVDGAGVGVCDTFSPVGSSNLQGFITQNGHVYLPGDPGYVNLEVACSAVSVDSLRKYQGYGQILSLQNVTNSSYNALQFTIRHVTRPISVGLSYTYGHSIDEASDRYSSALGNSLNPASNRASSDFDQRHMLNVSYVYKLPLVEWITGARKALDSMRCHENDLNAGCPADSPPAREFNEPSRLVRSILENWQLSGVTTFQTGTPFSIVNGGSSLMSVLDNAGVANGMGAGSYPDVNRSASPCYGSGASGIGPLLGNPCEFVAPRGLTFGNAGRNFMNNPNRFNVDLALAKQVTLPHERSLEFRAEVFNFFNNVQYRIYDPSIGNTASNTITCYGDVTTGYSAAAPGCLTNSQFLRPVNAHRPRTAQFGLKVGF